MDNDWYLKTYKHYLKIFGTMALALLAIMLLAIGLIMQASLGAILLVESIVLGTSAILMYIAWLAVPRILPNILSFSKEPQLNTTVRLNKMEGKAIEYALDMDDVIAFQNQFHSSRFGRIAKFARYLAIATATVEFVIAVVLLTAFNDLRPFAISLIVLAVLTIFWLSLFPLLLRYLRKDITSRVYGQGKNRILGKHKVTITCEGILDTTEVGQSSINWKAVDDVVSNEQHLFILVKTADPYIVPRRAFADEATFKQFGDEAKAYCGA
jgi:hypothetical protein